MSELDCRTCGACCVVANGDARVAVVSSEDAARLTNGEHELLLEFRSKLFTKTKVDARGRTVCVFFEDAGGQATCSIYDRRPAVCACFEGGSTGCEAARSRNL